MRRLTSLKATLPVLILTLLLAACGTKATDDQEAVSKRAREYFAAYNNGDYQALCATLSAKTHEQQQQSAGDCAEQLQSINYIEEASKSRMGEITLDSSAITITGDTATLPKDAITYSDDSHAEANLMFVRENNEWLVDLLP